MPPKRIKSITPSGVTPTAPAAANKSWETGLTGAVFEEDGWKASVCLLQVEEEEDEPLISALQQAVRQPLRKLFSALSWENTREKINELGNPKTRKNKDVPMFFEVTEVAKSLMDAGEEITVDLMAKLIKFQLLVIKNNDIQRRAAERKVSEENALVKPVVNSASKDQAGKAAAKGKKVSDPPVPTKDTKLKRRGEEETTIKYIDDEPEDGPQHYILMMGFHQPHLISVLDSLGIHVSSVIMLRLQRDDQSVAQAETAVEENHHSPEDEEGGILKQKRQKELDVFWKQLDQVLNSGNLGSRLYDVARLSYSEKLHLLPQDTDNTEAMLAFGAAIFEGVACLVYDSLDWRRQHSHYLNCMRLIPVPVACRPHQQLQPQSATEAVQTPRKKATTENEPESDPPALSTEVDMRRYCDLLDRIPPENTSVSLILHAMLEQVVTSKQEDMTGSFESEQHSDKEYQDLLSYMLSSILSLPLSEKDRKEVMDGFGMKTSPTNTDQNHPLLINHHDERKRRLHPLPVHNDFDAIKIEADIIKQTLDWTSLMSKHAENASDRLARSQELLHFTTDDSLSWSEAQRLLKRFVFESMPLTTVDENSCIKGSLSAPLSPTPWDKPVEFAKHLYWDKNRTPGSAEGCSGTEDQKQGNEVSLTDLQKTLIRQLGNWNFVEHHSADIFPQVLQSASETYKCMDTFYCSRDNAIYVICHDPMSPQRSCKEFWDASLHTDVGFRDYMEYVADSISEWTTQEEEQWRIEQERKEAERNLLQTPPETDRKRDSPIKTPNPETVEQYIREDSLKAWKIKQDRLREEEQLKRAKNEKGGKATPKVREETESVKENKKTPLSSRKNRENLSETPNSVTLSRNETRDIPQTPQGPANEKRPNVFTGYNLNGKLVQVRGKTQSLYPCDGGLIDVESFHFIQGLSQVKVCVKKDGHHFYTYISEREREQDKLKDADLLNKQVSLGVSPACETETCGCFYAVLANGIQLSCIHTGPNKTRGQTLQPTASNFTFYTEQPADPKVRSEPEDSSSPPPFNSLHVSVPSGLILHFDFEDSVDGDSSGRSLVVHQRIYRLESSTDLNSDTTKHTEASRVITSKGTVVKHMRDGSTEVLFADGTISRSLDSGPVCVLVPHMPEKEVEPIKEHTMEDKDTKNRNGKADSKTHGGVDQAQSVEKEQPKCSLKITGGSWTTTTPSGLRVATVAGQTVKVQPILSYHATDPFDNTVVVTREDKVLSVLRKDETVIVDHADGTRITTFYQQREPQQYLSSGQDQNAEPSKQKLLRVEKSEFATVIMNYDGKSCDVLFGDGTLITATVQGSYKIYPCGGGVLHINEEGGAVYSSPWSAEGPERDQMGQYVMSPRADLLCHVTDHQGNWFQVNADGQISVTANGSEQQKMNEPFKTHPPRLFVVNEDGSASELLRDQDVENLLQESYSDSSIAVLTEPLSASQELFGITLLKPCPEVNDSHWLLPKQEDDIIPTHLKSRKWESFPASEKKTSGPPFGTTLGCGLEIKKKPKPSLITAQPVLECPDVLLVRQITQHPPVTEPLQRKLQEKVKAYLEELMHRESQWEQRQLKDPRTAEERIHQNHLLQLVLSMPDPGDPSVTMEKTPLLADVASHYIQAVGAAQHHDKQQEMTEEKAAKCVNKKKQKSLWENRKNRHRQELQEHRSHRDALRHQIVTSYFHPELKEMSVFMQQDLNLNTLSPGSSTINKKKRKKWN